MSSSRASLIIKEPAEPLTTPNPLAANRRRPAVDEFVAEPLVIPLPVVMRDELGDRPAEITFTERDHPVEALVLDRAREALRVRIGVCRRLHRRRVMRDKGFASRIPSIRSMAVPSNGSTAGRRGGRIASISTTMPGSSLGCRCGGPMSSPLIPPRYLAQGAHISGTTICRLADLLTRLHAAPHAPRRAMMSC